MGKDFSAPRGVKKQIFGSILFFLGALNTLLSIKGGLPLDGFFLVLMLGGGLIFLYGALERASKQPSTNASSNRDPE